MSRSLPPEILDLIVDHLHDETTTLKACCAVSKSWIPRTRKHLFACVELHGPRITQLWTKAFPDPHSSPARHTRTLSFEGIPVVTAAGTEVGGWIPAFCNVINLHFSARDLKPQSTLIPFYGLSPNVRSLRLTWISSEFFDLICSFPLLEDLALHYSAPRDYTAEWSVPSTSPKLTGSLELIATIGAIFSVARRLLDLPDGLHFTKITVSCLSENDVRSATDLVSRCFDTLRSLTVCCHIRYAGTPIINLNKAIKLKELTFRCNAWSVHWVVAMLQTAESKDLEQVALYPYKITFGDSIDGTVTQDWQDLDRLLVQLWNSRSVRSCIRCEPNMSVSGVRDSVQRLLPELTRRGLVDIVEVVPSSRRFC